MLWIDYFFKLMLADTDRRLNSTSNKTNRSKTSLFIKKLLHLKKWVNLFLGHTVCIYMNVLKCSLCIKIVYNIILKMIMLCNKFLYCIFKILFIMYIIMRNIYIYISYGPKILRLIG